MSTRSNRPDRRARLANSWRGIHRRLRGRGGLITFLATAGVLGLLSGFALASGSPGDAVGPVPDGCTRVNGSGNDNAGVDMGTTVINGVTLHFTQTGQGTMHWEVVDPPGGTFIGTITMKGGPDLDGIDFTYTAADNASSGDVHTPVNSHNGRYYGISHAQSCGNSSTTTSTSSTDSTTTLTVTLPDTTTTVTGPDTTSTITEPATTSTITLPDTTTTVTDPDTTTTITEPDTTSTVTEDVTTTTTAPETTLTTTIPCLQQAHREITPSALTTITVLGSTITQTEPGSTETITEPGSTSTITQDGTTQTVTVPGNTITQTQPGSTFTTTVPGSTFVSTIPGTTQTVTDCTSETSTTTVTDSTESTSTGAVLGTSTSDGGTTTKLASEKSDGGEKREKREKREGRASDPVAASATGASGGLPFTGMHVPLLILVGVGMGATGLMFRRRLGSLD